MSEADPPGWQVAPEAHRALWLANARDALRRRDPARAVTELEEFLDRDPTDIEALWWLGCALMEQRDYPVATPVWDQLADRSPTDALAHHHLALCLFETHQFAESEASVRQALGLAPQLAEAWYLLALLMDRKDAHTEATQAFWTAYRASPLGFPPPLLATSEDWHQVVRAAFQRTPEETRSFWSGVPVHLERHPGLDDLRSDEGAPLSPRVLALYGGQPGDPAGHPESVRIFVGNLALHDSLEAAVEALAAALQHEAEDWRYLGRA